jgi:hypothetical protein
MPITSVTVYTTAELDSSKESVLCCVYTTAASNQRAYAKISKHARRYLKHLIAMPLCASPWKRIISSCPCQASPPG